MKNWNMNEILKHCAGPNSPSKYPLELGIQIGVYRGNRTMELVGEGYSYEDAAKIAEKEINEKWG